MGIKLFEDFWGDKDDTKRELYKGVEDILYTLGEYDIEPFIQFDKLGTELTISFKTGVPDTAHTYSNFYLFDNTSKGYSYEYIKDRVDLVIAYLLDNNEYNHLINMKLQYMGRDLRLKTREFSQGFRALNDGVKNDIETTISFVEEKINFTKEVNYHDSNENDWITRLILNFKIYYK